MDTSQIVINTILFSQRVARGARQADFFEEVKDNGISKVEVRYEYFTDDSEFSYTARAAAKYGLELWLSIPGELFRNGRLQLTKMHEVLGHARELGACSVKWNRGDFQEWTVESIGQFRQAAQDFDGLLMIENDQTQESGQLVANLRFLQLCREQNLPVFTTFDIGNWSWTGENAVENAQILKDFVRYIHIKDVAMTKEGPKAVPLGQGQLPLKDILAVLPEVPVALEYEGGVNPLKVIQAGINWLV